MSKQASQITMQDAFAFFQARKACREHVLKHAKVRHEPTKLINSSLWGKDLFPSDVVKEILDGATRESKSLLDKWDASSKRKSSSSASGSTPKRFRPYYFHKKKGSQGNSQQKPHQQQQQSTQQPQPSTSGLQQASTSQAASSFSPAYVPKREAQPQSYGSLASYRGSKAPFRGARGGFKGRGGRGRGAGRGSQF